MQLQRYQNDLVELSRGVYAIEPEKDIMICTIGLAGEVGEVSEHIKKYFRDGKPVNIEKLALELGDVLAYTTILCEYFGLELNTVAKMNLEKLKDRYSENKENTNYFGGQIIDVLGEK